MNKKQVTPGLKIFVLLLSACAALSLTFDLPAAALEQPLLSGAQLAVPVSEQPPSLVLQIIDGKLHKWLEFGSQQGRDGSVILLEPEQKALSTMEINRLFKASRKWEEQHHLRLTALSANQVTRTSLVDNRSPIDSSLSISYPHNTIGMLTVSYSSQHIRGTGFLISPYAVLTNAHNLYTTSLGGWHNLARFSPGQYETIWPESRQPFSTREAIKAEVNQNFLRFENSNDRENLIRYDYGALFFDQPFEGITTFMPLQFNQVPTSVSVVGYPGFVRGSPSHGQWLAQGTVLSRNDYCLFYDALTSGGSSGSPVFTYNHSSGTYRIVAIHSFAYENQLISGGPHLNNFNQDQIESWLRWTPEPSTSPIISLALDKTALTLDIGAIEALIATIAPAEFATLPLTWSSSNNNVATVSENGLITAKNGGRATITVRTADGTASASCEVTVVSAGREENPAIITILGDLNGDWLINVQDVILAQRHVLDLQLLPANLADQADVNRDGLVDVRDVSLIMRFSLGLINNL